MFQKVIPRTCGLKTTYFNAEVIEIKIPSIIHLTTTATLHTVENKISNVSYLVKKNWLWCKNIWQKTSDYNKNAWL